MVMHRPEGGSIDAVVVGSGPNGLAAAVTLAQGGLSVTVLEAADQIGGGTRTAELTVPGVRHDVCSAVHPLGCRLAVSCRRCRSPSTALSGGGRASTSPIRSTVAAPASCGDRSRTLRPGLGADGEAWRRSFGPLADRFDALCPPSCCSRSTARAAPPGRPGQVRPPGRPASNAASPAGSATEEARGAVRRLRRPLHRPADPTASRHRSARR